MEAAIPDLSVPPDAAQITAATNKMPALVAMLRHDMRINDADIYMHHGQRWVRATALYEKHRRFHRAFPLTAMLAAALNHTDRSGNLYVLIHVDMQRDFWLHAPRR